MAKVIGMHIGMTKARVGVMEKQPVVIANAQGLRITPASVAYTSEGTCLVGKAAQAYAIRNPANAFHSIRQFLGCRYDEVTESATSAPYQVLRDREGGILLNCPNLPEPLSPEAILAPLLRQLADNASVYLGEEVIKVVLTVPAYFTDAQRQAMKDAARLAGLEALRIINESAAACLTYRLDQETDLFIIVLNLDRSTFDVTVLEVGDGVFETLAATTTNLGDNDSDPDQINDRPHRYHDCIEQAIAAANLRPSDQISEVVLVGDAGRSAALTALAQQITGKPLLQKYPSEEIVAMGAAYQAGVLSGEVVYCCQPSYAICAVGVETSDGLMTPMIERGGSYYNRRRSVIFSTTFDGQTSVEIPILRGLRVLAKDNQRLHTLYLHGILPAPQGIPKIEITFNFDVNENLEVIAKDWATGETVSTQLPQALSLEQGEFDRLYRDANENEVLDSAISLGGLRNHVSYLILQMGGEVSGYMRTPTIDIARLKQLLEQLQTALEPLETCNRLKPATQITPLLPIEKSTLRLDGKTTS